METLEILKALVLGIMEGLTEFAPISSTGHMIIFDDLWLNTEGFLGGPSANTFKIVIQLGSILAVVFIFWKRMLSLVGLYKLEQDTPMTFNILHVLMGIIPAGVFGLLFEDFIDEHLFSIETVLIGLVIGAFFMIIADKFGPKNPSINSLDEISYLKALTVGTVQCFPCGQASLAQARPFQAAYCWGWITELQLISLLSWPSRSCSELRSSRS